MKSRKPFFHAARRPLTFHEMSFIGACGSGAWGLTSVRAPALLAQGFLEGGFGRGAKPPFRVFYADCWIAESRQGLGPTGRTKVQNSSNFTGSVGLPSSTCVPASSVV